ncbi:MAG: IS200/IS605 family transposase [Candidatus Liptonbacteria bacterium]|nr:IS200/IS605 family transposase [Candidatus Liptonbacteria bacterium]
MQRHYRKDHHCIWLCDYRLVLPTKYRRKIFNEGLFVYLKRKLLDIPEHYPQIFFKEINHDQDHIHVLVSIPPQMTVGSVVRLIKTNTSRKLKEQFPFLKQVYWGTDGIWSEGCFVLTVGVDEATIRRYIEAQGNEDAGQTGLAV